MSFQSTLNTLRIFKTTPIHTEAPVKNKMAALGILLLSASLTLTACSSTRSLSSKNSELIRAAEKGETKEVYRLLAAGADVNARNAEGWTPYMAASSMGQLDAMRVLVAFGAKTIPSDLREDNTYHKYLADR